MRKRKIQPDWRWPSWRYGPAGQSAIFQCEEDIPEGWTRKPDEAPEIYVPRPAPIPLDKEKLVAELLQLGIPVHPLWCNAHMKKVIDDSRSAR